MGLIPIRFDVHMDDINKASAEDIEASIKNEVLENIIKAILPKLDDENVIKMTQSPEDESIYNIEIDLVMLSKHECIEAAVETTSHIAHMCKEYYVTDPAIINDLVQAANESFIKITS